MFFLLDQGLPRDAASLLRESGVPFNHVGEVGLSRAPDDVILEYARLHNRTIVT